MGSNNQLVNALLLFVLVVTLCISSSSLTATAEQLVLAPYPTPPSHAPAPAPAPHHHHHHHHNHAHSHHITSPPPAHSPAISPSIPTLPPTQPPARAKPPAKAPVSQPPTQPPVGSPMMPPTKAPAPHIMPPRKFVAVQGVVYCKNCSYNGRVDTLLGASPLSGAKVELRCRNTKYLLKKTSTTDENGYFFLQAPPLITTYGAHKCRVFLLENPKNNGTAGGACSHATNLNGGVTGAYLFLDKKSGPPHRPVKFSLFTVGPFAFAPSKCYKH